MIRAALVTLALTAPATAQDLASAQGAFLRGLDKVSGVTTDLAVPVGGSVTYGRMTIALTACRYPAENPAANAYAFLDISDDLTGQPLFRGWMIATAPALNALDHARYDVWVIGCD
jgi:hypothetical protein